MAVTAPKVFTIQSPAVFFAGRRVIDVPIRTMIRNQNCMYARSGARSQILVRSTPWQTSSATRTQVDSSADLIDLDTYQACLRCVRPLDLTLDTYRIQVRAMIQDLDVLFRVYDVLSDTDLGTINLSDGTGVAVVAEGSLDLTVAEAETGGAPRVLLLSIVGGGLKTTTGGTVGYLWGAIGFEAIASASELP